MAVAVVVLDDASADGVGGAPIEAGDAVLAAVLPDGPSLHEFDVAHRADLRTDPAAVARVGCREAPIGQGNQILHREP